MFYQELRPETCNVESSMFKIRMIVKEPDSTIYSEEFLYSCSLCCVVAVVKSWTMSRVTRVGN